jgi:NAD(P)-dependent dehydrogenase (short-subunit alcohol dehydrogenase family)
MGMLDGKVALVTGGGSGIGRATALRFAREGARISVVDVDDDDGTVAEIERGAGGGGGRGSERAIFSKCDVSKADDVRRAVDEAVATFGRLDVVVANAGINGVWAPIDELKPEEFDRTIAINLRGTYLTVHFAVPHLKRAGGGSIIITSSVNGNRSFSTPGATAYSSTKAAQVAIAKQLALELGRHQIRVNAICPGAIHTNIQQSTVQRDTEKLGLKVEFPAGAPGIHHGQADPDVVADACLFLASDLGRHVSGVELYVDGGLSLMR